MNLEQGQIISYILERVQDGKVEEAKALLLERFSKQSDGAFTPAYKKAFIEKLNALLNPEKIEDVKNFMLKQHQKQSRE